MRRSRFTREQIVYFFAVLFLGVAWRLLSAYVVVPTWEQASNLAPAPDAYPVLATELLQNHTLGFGEYGASPTSARAPGFPIWLALGILLGGDSTTWLGFWTSIPAILAAALLAQFIRDRYGAVASFAFLAVAILHPLPTFVSGRSMSDEFFAATAVLTIFMWSRAGNPNGTRHQHLLAVLAAAVFGTLHVLTRGNGLLTIAIGAVFFTRVRPPLDRRTLFASLAILLAALGAGAGWTVRTSLLEGRPVIVQSLLGYNFWMGDAFNSLGQEAHKGEKTLDRVTHVFAQIGREPPQKDRFWWGQLTPQQLGEYEPLFLSAAAHHIVSQPGAYLRRVLSGMWQFWTRGETRSRSFHYVLVNLPLLLLGVLGVATTLRDSTCRDPFSRPFLCLILGNMIFYAAVFPMARFSVQVYPALAYFVAVAVSSLQTRWRSSQNKQRSHLEGQPT